MAGRIGLSLCGCFSDETFTALSLTDPTTAAVDEGDDDVFDERRVAVPGLCCRATTDERRLFSFNRPATVLAFICFRFNNQFPLLLEAIIIRSTCNSRDTLLSEALIYRLRGHYVGLRRKSGPIRCIRADIVTLWAISALI